MNRGLIIRAFRELWGVTLLAGLVFLAVETALGFVLPKFGAQMSREWMVMDFVRTIMKAMLGAEISDSMGPHMFHAMAWVHPFVLALSWAHAVVCCTRVPAGEVDRGTADVLLSLPVSRREIFLSESLVWLVCGVAVFAAALAGNILGGWFLPPEQRPELARLLPVMLNFFSLYAAAGGLTWLISSFSSRRGRAMTIVFLILMALFLLHYLAQFWSPLQAFAFLSPLTYYQPVTVFNSGTWPWHNMAVLTAAGAAMWAAGGIVFSRRDLCTV